MNRIKAQLIEAINDPCNSMNCCQPCMDCKEDKKLIVARMDEGHTYHCACRFVWGDGECECETGPGPVSEVILNILSIPVK